MTDPETVSAMLSTVKLELLVAGAGIDRTATAQATLATGQENERERRVASAARLDAYGEKT